MTGARGWLGRCVCNRFREEGWRVRELTRSPEPAAVERGEAIPFHLGDGVAPQVFTGATALVHCAYDFAAPTWREIHSRNVRGAAVLFEAARAVGVARLVCISTMSAFAGCQSLYGRAKLESEKMAFGAGALVLRPGLIWGAEAGGMFGALVKQVRGGRAIPLIGGDQTLYLVHQEDLTGLIHRFACGDFNALSDPVTAAHERP